jgi:hypothetical protein
MLIVSEMYGVGDTIWHDGQIFEVITRRVDGVVWHGPKAIQDKS